MRNVYIILLIFYFSTYAQNENNHWQLGPVDLDFSTNPNTVNSISTATGYGVATISDTNGNLLFYTNGSTVWNKNHQVMTNGLEISEYNPYDFPLQKALIIPHPGDHLKYYIFRIFNMACTCVDSDGDSVYLYSIVDFNSNSLGEVIAINTSPNYLDGEQNIYTKAIAYGGGVLRPEIDYNPLTFTTKGTNDGYWLIVQDRNTMLSYSIDSSGLSNSPVASSFGSNTIYSRGTFNSTVGRLDGRARSMFRVATGENGSKLYGLESADVNMTINDGAYHPHKFYKLDFNNLTGQFSNYQAITVEGYFAYNFELSPDFSKAYFVTYSLPNYTVGDGEIWVKDLLNTSTQARRLYEYSTPTTGSTKFSFIQKDRYDNLLISSTSTTSNRNKYIHKIDNPNSFLSSSVIVNHIYLNNYSISNLPQLIPEINNCPDYLTLTVANNVTSGTDLRKAEYTITASNVISSGATGIYHAGQAIVLTTGFRSVSGSSFRAYIEGCSGETEIHRANIATDETPEVLSLKEGKIFILSPNPASDVVAITSTETMQNITVTSFDGKIILNKNLSEKDYKLELPIRDYINGFYTITVTTVNGKVETQKLIKN